MTIIEQIRKLNLPSDTKINLYYSEGTDVFVHNETEIETALENTVVVRSYVEVILDSKLNATTTWGDIPVAHLREQGLLEDYDREGWFADYLVDCINDNFYDAEVIEYSIEKYDHKRGFCTLSAELYTTAEHVLASTIGLDGWKVTVETSAGDLILK
mgnify:CR=1 FL=1|tara:strand:+ start:1538 stop:2008 length:471 start_codon:yes stop_codon:yes gene_type:complete